MSFQLKSAVKHIMTKELYLLNIQDPISLVKKIFDEYKLRHLPVVCNNEAVGMVDVNDLRLLNIHSNKQNELELKIDLKVEEFMHKDPYCVHEDETIYTVSEKFKEGKYHAIPVKNHKGVVGIITTTDIIRFLMEYSSSLKQEDVYPKTQLS